MYNIKDIVCFKVEESSLKCPVKNKNKDIYVFDVEVEMKTQTSEKHYEKYDFNIIVDENNEYYYEFEHSRIYSKYSTTTRRTEALCCNKKTRVCHEATRKIADEVFEKIISSDFIDAKAFLSRNARKKELNYDPQKEEQLKSSVYSVVNTLTSEMKERFENALNIVEKEREFLLSEEVTSEEIALHESYAVVDMQNVLQKMLNQIDAEVVDRVCKYFEEKEVKQ